MSREERSVSGNLIAALGLVATACVLAISIVPPGATRMYAWPWSVWYGVALVCPAAIVLLRAFDRQHPLVLPSTAWRSVSLGAALVTLASALFSPYRATALLWSAPLLSAIAVFLVAFDWLHAAPAREGERREHAWTALRWILLAVAVASVIEWLGGLRHASLTTILQARNPYPLGHSNYTAAIGLLMLPACASAAVGVRARRWVAVVGVLFGLELLLTSASRGAMIALVVLAAGAVAAAPLRRNARLALGIGALLLAVLVAAIHPRTRAMLRPSDPAAPPNISNVQRTAMLVGGARMGADRPWLGWGPGTTPLAFPRYRADLDGGAEDVLQLHSLPVQLWAELGGGGVLVGLGVLWLVARDRRRDPVAALTLGAYAVFSLFDAQLDVPFFGFALALLAALVAAPGRETTPVATGHPPSPANRGTLAWSRAVGAFAGIALATIVLLGHRDRAAELNVRALSDAIGRDHPQPAVALLRESLALNPDQEIAHFNLGWLFVVEDPPAATRHFTAAARLVPDKGGVYFGLGLARLNAGDQAGAAHAFALEALNDPVFILSPWWSNPQLQTLRPRTLAELEAAEQRVAASLPESTWAGREVRYLRELNRLLTGQTNADAVARVATTPQRRAFLAQHPTVPTAAELGTRTLRRQRLGYPVLMRNLDLPAPLDLWAVQESAARSSRLAFLWPDKGWLPSPLLIALLETPESPKK